MKKPERWRESTVISQSEGQAGYNIAFDKWEAYHKQEMDKIKQSVSVDKIQKIMYKTEDDYELGETNSLHIAIAKAISKSIIGR